MTQSLRFAALAVAVASLWITGCSTIPSVPYTCQANEAAPPATFAAATRACTQTLVTSISTARQKRQTNSDLAKAGTFVGALAAGTAAMFKGHRDLIVGSALFGATSYQLGNLYASESSDTIMLAGLSAATCVDSIALSLGADIADVADQISTVSASGQRLATLSAASDVSPGVKHQSDVAVNKALNATAEAYAKLVSTRAANARILGAASSIHLSIEQQLAANAPKLDAFQAAAAAALAAGRAAAPQPPPAAQTPVKSFSPTSPTPDSPVLDAIESLAALTQALTDSTARLGAIDTSACEAKAVAALAEVLSVTPANVDLSGGQTINVVVHGGQPSYRGQWKGAEPPAAEVTVNQAGNAFQFKGTKASKTYTYEISDQLGKSIDIPVKN